MIMMSMAVVVRVLMSGGHDKSINPSGLEVSKKFICLVYLSGLFDGGLCGIQFVVAVSVMSKICFGVKAILEAGVQICR